jgi:peptidoglycan-associated lipoprotein
MTGHVQLVLDKIYQNKMIVIHNIYYDYDKWNIRQDAKKSLDTIVQLLNENPGIKVEIGSHTDQRGSDMYNNDLSQKRAQSVVDYLVLQGINSQRLTAHGYGKTELVVNCNPCTEEQYQLNRRTTFKVTSDNFNLESIQPKNVTVDSSALKKKQ